MVLAILLVASLINENIAVVFKEYRVIRFWSESYFKIMKEQLVSLLFKVTKVVNKFNSLPR